MPKKKVMLVGESWVSSAVHLKGFDQFSSVTFHRGADPLLSALRESQYEVTYLLSHQAAEELPATIEELDPYEAIILSDIGANTLLLHPDVWLRGKPYPNRLNLLRDWTARGGGLAMIGGYFSFQGIDGRARWARTPVEQALPVTCLHFDDRLEIPEGFEPVITAGNHPILRHLDDKWPVLLGANEVKAKNQSDVEILARLPDEHGGHPLLVIGRFGLGRTLAWMSDIGPHWAPQAFVEWKGYVMLWTNVLDWLTSK
jgi:uncharacterized membrane protein